MIGDFYTSEKNKTKTARKMNNQTFVTRRGSSSTSANWTRNRNTVAYGKNGLGKVSYGVVVGMLTLIVGLIYVAQGTKATSYDYQISEVEGEIAELTAKKDDLAVEQARLTSIAKANESAVAVAMEDAKATGYAAE